MFAIDLQIPVIETERLILRGHHETDFAFMLAMWQDPVVQRHFGGQPMSREDAWGRFLKSAGSWAVLGYGMFAIEDKKTGAYAGATGAFNAKRTLTPPIEGMPEAGWAVAPQFHGRGYATEATRAALTWVDGRLVHPAIFCSIVPANVESIRVAEKCGFERWYETKFDTEPMLVFRRPPGGIG